MHLSHQAIVSRLLNHLFKNYYCDQEIKNYINPIDLQD